MVKSILKFFKKEMQKEIYLKVIFITDYFFILCFIASGIMALMSLLYPNGYAIFVTVVFEIIFMMIIIFIILKIKFISYAFRAITGRFPEKLKDKKVLITISFVISILNFILTSIVIQKFVESIMGGLIYG